MRIAVIGPGALGCLLAARLARQGRHEVWLLDRDPGRVAVLERDGVRLEEAGRILESVRVRATKDAAEIGSVELVLLCVKSHAVRGALAQIRMLAGPDNLLLAFQNGIGHVQLLQEEGGSFCWAIGVTAQGATLLGPGRVRHGGSGPTRIGCLEGVAVRCGGPERLCAVASLLTAAGFGTTVSGDILADLWAKLLINVGINALTAMFDCPNGGLLERPEARQWQEAAVLEAAAVGGALGIAMPKDPVGAARMVCRATAANISSMLQDVRARRPTEINAINGAVVAEARRLGLAVPVNAQLVGAVRAIERGYLSG